VELRQRLALMRNYLLTCKNEKAQLLALLEDRLYMLNDTILRDGEALAGKEQAEAAAQSVSNGRASPAPASRTSSAASASKLSSRSRVSVGSVLSPAARSASPFAAEEEEELPVLCPPDDLLDPADSAFLHPSLRDMWSLKDLVDTLSGTLLPHLTRVFKALTHHIVSGRCVICSSKGFFCSCKNCPKQNDSQAIYPFQTATVQQCAVCGHCAHKECMAREGCPRCERARRRKAAQAQRIAAAKQALVQHARSGSLGGAGSFVGAGSPSFSSLAVGSPSGASVSSLGSLVASPVAAGSRSLGFIATGGDRPSSGRHSASGDVVASLERTRGGGSRGSSPVRKLNEKIAKRRQEAAQRDDA